MTIPEVLSLAMAIALAASPPAAGAPAPAAPSAAAPATEKAPARPATLRYRLEPGQLRVYERTTRTDAQATASKGPVRTVTEAVVRYEETVVDTRAEPPAARIVALEVPAPERLVAYEENGQDRLPTIPEQGRSRPLLPALAAQWLGRRGETQPDAAPPKITDAAMAFETLLGELRTLPEQPVKPGDTWSRELDLGVAHATITFKYVADRAEGTTPCAVVEASAVITFNPDFAKQIQVEKVTLQTAVALDGSGWVSQSGASAVTEKSDRGQRRVARTFQTKLTQATRLSAAQLEKAKADLAAIDKAAAQAKADDLDASLGTFSAFLKDNAGSPWVGAVQIMRDSIMARRRLTKPVEAAELQLMLQQLQTDRDRASATGGPAQVQQVDQIIRQIVTVNSGTVFQLASDPDPLIRDLGVFALTFSKDDRALARIQALAQDLSPQVRGTAAIGLALQAKPAEPAILNNLLKDTDPRVRGAAALLAMRTVKKDDPQAAAVVPLLAGNLKTGTPWSRMNTIGALATLAPAGSAPAAAALVAGYKEETEPRLQPLYLQALKEVTGVDSKDLPPYEDWLKKQPVAPPPPPAVPPPAPGPAPAPPAAPSPVPAPAPKG